MNLIMIARMYVCAYIYVHMFVCMYLCMYVGVHVRLEQAVSGLFKISPGNLEFVWAVLGFWSSLDVSRPFS